MSFEEFCQSIGAPTPPVGLGKPLEALWQDARGDWETAHSAAQADASGEAAWVHAYLHRKEGDRGNAGYWYRRANRPIPAEAASLEQEWEQIARVLLGK